MVATAERWAGAGGTHLSVVSMQMGFDSADAHVDFFGQVAARAGPDRRRRHRLNRPGIAGHTTDRTCLRFLLAVTRHGVGPRR